MIEFVKGTFIIAGALLMLLASLGILRLPDLLTRMHATTKAAALGVILIMLAVAMHYAEVGVSARAFAIIVFILMTAPVAAHVIGRAGYFVGSKLWSGTVKDELRPNYDPLTHELKSGMESIENTQRQPRDTDPD
ncbi:monovalent cation/H(+) antiporter subunit G [Vreelandella rituensis]|uniref:Monovalent cation/H(+) antiporter subunit G n=1 Tax=Vreelandella rituensis TaxID=2282306 RepID=A0A368U6N1_9GAMM|nr:monovalent cation/H(+) antiporter subunit G [Halomonas rituensis]RCV92645.1 monovalent cation/H(+) antiporter subunit G [Halomonas rituensis]